MSQLNDAEKDEDLSVLVGPANDLAVQMAVQEEHVDLNEATDSFGAPSFGTGDDDGYVFTAFDSTAPLGTGFVAGDDDEEDEEEVNNSESTPMGTGFAADKDDK